MLELLNNLKEYGSCEMTCDNCPIKAHKGVTPDTCYLLRYLIKIGAGNVVAMVEHQVLHEASVEINGETK